MHQLLVDAGRDGGREVRCTIFQDTPKMPGLPRDRG
jgi:hypothetical protein